MENQQTSQLRQANEALKALKPNITTSDREQSGYSEFTIVNYLNGRGKDLDTAVTLLTFFRKRIEDRGKLIENQPQN